jgi:hypothetical protein
MMIEEERLNDREIGVLLSLVTRKLRYEERRAYTEPELGVFKRMSLAQIQEKLERMRLAS